MSASSCPQELLDRGLRLLFGRIYDYLTKTNVQLGATYAVGEQSNAAYEAGYAGAAKYINASPEEIGNLCSLM